MSHREIYKRFESYFPSYINDGDVTWYPNGKNGIKVRHHTGQEYLFTFNNSKDWSFQTLGNSINTNRK